MSEIEMGLADIRELRVREQLAACERVLAERGRENDRLNAEITALKQETVRKVKGAIQACADLARTEGDRMMDQHRAAEWSCARRIEKLILEKIIPKSQG